MFDHVALSASPDLYLARSNPLPSLLCHCVSCAPGNGPSCADSANWLWPSRLFVPEIPVPHMAVMSSNIVFYIFSVLVSLSIKIIKYFIFSQTSRPSIPSASAFLIFPSSFWQQGSLVKLLAPNNFISPVGWTRATVPWVTIGCIYPSKSDLLIRVIISKWTWKEP